VEVAGGGVEGHGGTVSGRENWVAENEGKGKCCGS